MHLVVGLGNPGSRYDRTRHNVGFEVADRLADRHGVSLREKRFKAVLGSGRIANEAVVLAKPQTFMNLSGDSIGPMSGWYKLGLDEVIVVHDDLDLPFGDVRVKVGGGHGGHNGLRSLVQRLPGPGFVRVRVGIGRPQGPMDVSAWVLSRWSSEEASSVDGVVDKAADAVEAVLELGAKAAMNRINGEGKARRRKKNKNNDGGAATASADETAPDRRDAHVGS